MRHTKAFYDDRREEKVARAKGYRDNRREEKEEYRKLFHEVGEKR